MLVGTIRQLVCRVIKAVFLNHNVTSLPFALIFHSNAIFNCICCLSSFSLTHKRQTVYIPEASPFSKAVFLRKDLIQHKRGKLHFYILYNSRVISLHVPNIQMFVLRQAGDAQGSVPKCQQNVQSQGLQMGHKIQHSAYTYYTINCKLITLKFDVGLKLW